MIVSFSLQFLCYDKITKALQLFESGSTMSVSTMSDPNLQQYFKVFGTIACVKAKQFQNVT